MKQFSLFSTQKDYLLLTRSVKGRVRYYLLKIEETLFGEYLLEKVYGSMSHKKPTRILKEYYTSCVKAKKILNELLIKKKKRGYTISNLYDSSIRKAGNVYTKN